MLMIILKKLVIEYQQEVPQDDLVNDTTNDELEVKIARRHLFPCSQYEEN